jgi:hypothetical protein
MPEHDSTSSYDHLIALVQEYRELTELLESGLLETADVLGVLGQRQTTHDQIIEELARLGQPVNTRQEALDIADRIAWWYHLGDEEE